MILLTATALEPLFSAIKTRYQTDLSNYAPASLERRIERFMMLYHFDNLETLTRKVSEDLSLYELFIREITVNTTEMFRDPSCWKNIRNNVLPLLKDLPSLRIWHAGCSSGEEIYSMLILLSELDMLDRTRIVASDLNRHILEMAKLGRYSKKSIELNAGNYKLAGGEKEFSDYFQEDETYYTMNRNLLSNVRFMRHDLSGGNTFSKFDLIICRNVLIYFNKTLQEKVFSLFRNSLFKNGFVIIGKKESMSYYTEFGLFNEMDASEKIYRLK